MHRLPSKPASAARIGNRKQAARCRESRILALAAAAALAGVFSSGQARAQNVITNGNFSANAGSYLTFPGYDGGSNPALPTNWNYTSNGGSLGVNGYDTVTTVFFNNSFSFSNGSPTDVSFTSTSGNTVNDFAFMQDNGGVMSQAVTTTPGHIYALTFDAAGRNDGEVGAWSVSLGGGSINTPILSNTQWQGYSYAFDESGFGAADSLAFKGLGSQQDVTNVNLTDITSTVGIWTGATSTNLGGSDSNFSFNGTSVNFATAVSSATNGALYFGDADASGNAIPTANANLTVVTGGVTAGTLNFINNSVPYTVTSSDSIGITGTTAIVKTGAATLSIFGTNTYTGGTTLTGGDLYAHGPSSLGAGTVTIGNGNYISLWWNTGNTTMTNNFVLNGIGQSQTRPDGAYETKSAIYADGGGGGYGSYTLSGTITLNANSDIGGTSLNNINITGQITGAGGLVKNYGNTVILSNSSNNYAGPTIINSGTLRLQATPSPTTTTFTTDAGSGIGTAGYGTSGYTHALAFGQQGTLSINGVTFTNASQAGSNYSTNDWNNNFPYNATSFSGAGSGTNELLSNFIYGTGNVGDVQTLTITGLTPGQTYDARIYYRDFEYPGNRTVNWSFDSGIGSVQTLTGVNEDADQSGNYVNFEYIAGAAGTAILSATDQTQGNSWHLYGFTNQQIANVSSSNILPTTTPVQISNGSTLDLNGVNQTVASLADGNGSGFVINSATLVPVTVTLSPPSGSTTFSGTISDNGSANAISFVKSNSGTQVLAGFNYYSGTTTISGGTLQLHPRNVGPAGATGSGNYTFTPASNNLIAGLLPIANTNPSPNQGGNTAVTGNVNLLTNGTIIANDANTYSIGNNTSLTYQLGNAANGYDISSINLYSGWDDTGRSQITLNDISYSTVANPNVFITIGGTGVNYNAAATNLVTITAQGEALATGVEDIRFDFGGQENGWVGYRQLEVVGTPNASNILPSTTAMQIASGATLDLGGTSQTVSGLADVVTGSGGAIINSAGTPASLIINLAGGANTYSGTISDNGSGNAISLVKSGNGTQILAGVNTYSGGTTLNAGTLNFANGSLGSGNVTFTGGTLQYAGTNTQDISGNIHNSTSAVMIDTNGQNVTYNSIIDGTNTGGLTKLGLSTLTLAATEAYSGNTVINGGVLKLGPVTSGLGYFKITGDADSGISTSNTYTQAINPNGGGFSVNGVPFTNASPGNISSVSSATYAQGSNTITIGNSIGNSNFGNNGYNGLFGWNGVTGNILNLFNNFAYNTYPLRTVVLTGLTPNTWYDVRLYEKQFDPSADRTFSVGYDVDDTGTPQYTSPTIDQNNPQNTAALAALGIGQQNAWAQTYVYETGAAQTSIALDINQTNPANTYHFYGLTNQVVSNGSFLPTTTAVSIGNNSSLDLAGASQQIASLSDSGPGLSDTVVNSNAGTPSVLLLATSGSASFSGEIGGGGGTIEIVMNGAGTQALAGVNTYSGGTTVNQGTLTGSTGSFGSGNVLVDPTGTTDTLADAATVISNGAIASTATVTVNSNPAVPTAVGTVNFLDATPTISQLNGTGNGIVGLNGAGGTALTITNGGTSSGTISDSGNGSVNLTGGILTLSGSTSSYQGGTIVTGGTLLADGGATNSGFGITGSPTGLGSVTVSAGGRLGGTGTIGNINGTVQINAGGIISPGDTTQYDYATGTGTLTTQNMTWTGATNSGNSANSSGAYYFKINTSTATIGAGLSGVTIAANGAASGTATASSATGNGQDLVISTGTGVLNIQSVGSGQSFVLNLVYSGSLTGPFIIANAVEIDVNDSMVTFGPLTGDFYVEENGIYNPDGVVSVVSDDSGGLYGSYDLVVSAPEPGSLSLLGVASLGLLRRRRRR